MKDNFFRYLEGIFNQVKIRADIEAYLLHLYGNTVSFEAFHEINGEERKIYYSKEDSLTVISIKSTKKYNGILYMPYIIDIVIGDFIKSDSSYFETNK